MLEELLLKYASPTLGGIKSGSLFKISKNDKIDLNKEVKNCNFLLNSLDVYLHIIYSCDKYALIYVYRSKLLINDFKNKNIIHFLKSYGYEGTNIEDYICYLKYRFELLNSTPHEVGVFLGYPLNDVKCFIKFKGKNFKLCGCWKAYDNIENCSKKFRDYKIYKEIFTYLYHHDYPLESLVFDGF